MPIEYKDYYEILGLEPGADDDDIRRAFRNLARKYHPDKSGGDREAEDRFKEINEAYEVLGDPSKRQRYDEFNNTWYHSPSAEEAWRQFSQPGFKEAHSGNRENARGFSDFFDQLFGERERPRSSNYRPKSDVRSRDEVEAEVKGRGDDLESDIYVTLEEVAVGGVRPIHMRRLERCPACFGVGQYNAHMCEKCSGNGNFLRSETYKVRVPKGIKEGAFLRIQGHGEKGVGNGPCGDLYLKVHYANHAHFRVEKGQLIHDLEVAPWEAVLGTVVVVPTLEGRATIKIPPGTRNGEKLRLRERGLPGDDGKSTDLIVNIAVQVPAVTAAKERDLWEELARTSGFNPRDN